jgi:nucleotide-binding universal stress UspA family protein
MTNQRVPAIVVGLNGSAGSLRALRWAVEEAALRSTPIQMVHAWQRGSHDYSGGEDQRHSLQLEALERATGWVLDVCGVGLLASVDIIEGSPAAVLVELSDQAELLVIGTQAHHGLGRLVTGSVSQRCLSHASCPVVAVPGPSQRHQGRDATAQRTAGPPEPWRTGWRSKRNNRRSQ